MYYCVLEPVENDSRLESQIYITWSLHYAQLLLVHVQDFAAPLNDLISRGAGTDLKTRNV